MSTPLAEQAPTSTPTPTRWAGVIGIEGEATGDGRYIDHNALTWDLDVEIPKLRYVSSDVGAHDGAVVVGRMDHIERRPGGVIWAEGTWDTSEVANEASRLVSEGMLDGVSMDLDNVTFEVRVAEELVTGDDADLNEVVLAQATDDDGRVVVARMTPQDQLTVTTDGRIRSATLVAIPAFARAKIGNTFADTAVATDAPSAEPTTEAAPSSDGQALFDEAVEALRKVDELEFLSPEYLAGADAAGDLFASAAQALTDTDPELAAVAAETAAKLKRFAALPWGDPDDVETRDTEGGDTAPDPTPEEVAAVVAAATPRPALTAAGIPTDPPDGWFNDPGLREPTPLTVTDDGRVYGHLASWDVCHVANPAGPGTCVVAPHSAHDYMDFHTGTIKTDGGNLLPVGQITLGTGHAGQKLNANAAAAHYDNTGTAVADVRVGEDQHGIWVAGALRPDVTDTQIRALRASPLSGDWRDRGGSLELIAALAVNVPGFPIPRPKGMVASGGDRLYSLVASGIITPTAPAPATLTDADLNYLHRIVQNGRRTEAMQLRREVTRSKVAVFAATRKG